MFRCPSCGNEDEFQLAEYGVRHIRITCYGDDSYSVAEEENSDADRWENITCCMCKREHSEDAYRDAFAAYEEPIPYTLVDASIT